MVLDGSYDPDASLRLLWNTSDLSFEIMFTTRLDYPLRMDQEQLIAIAESMQ